MRGTSNGTRGGHDDPYRPTGYDCYWHAGSQLGDKERAQWLHAIAAFEVVQISKGATAATIARRVKHVRRFAAQAQLSPWHVTPEDVLAWLQGLDVADSTRTAMRDSLRSFYRWALASERIASDPTAEESYRATRLPVPTTGRNLSPPTNDTCGRADWPPSRSGRPWSSCAHSPVTTRGSSRTP